MVTTLSFDRITGTASDVSMLKMSETTVESVSTETGPNTNRTTYTVADGDPRYPTTIVVQAKNDPKGLGGKGQRSGTISLNTWARVEVDGVLTDIQPINAMLAINIPTSVSIEIGDLRDMLEVLYALTYTTLTTKEPDNDRLSALCLFGVTGIL